MELRCNLVIDDGLALKGDRIVIPQSLKKEVLEAIYACHQGESKCLLLARESVYWPGTTNDVRDMVQTCEVCSRHQSASSKLPIMQPDMRTGPSEKIRHIWVQQREIPDDCRLLLQIFHCKEAATCGSADSLQQVHRKYRQNLECQLPSWQISARHIPAKSLRRNAEAWTPSPTVRHTTIKQIVWQKERLATVKQLWRKSLEDGQSKETALWMYRITPLDDNLPSPYELLNELWISTKKQDPPFQNAREQLNQNILKTTII